MRVAAVPANDRLVESRCRRRRAARRVGPERRARVLRDLPSDVARPTAVVEEGDVLRPGHADHHPQAMARSFVEQVDRRDRVGPDRVDAGRRHRREVLPDTFGAGKLHSVLVRSEGPVRHALHQVALVGDSDELTFAHGYVTVSLCVVLDDTDISSRHRLAEHVDLR